MTTTNKGCLGAIFGLFGSQPKATKRTEPETQSSELPDDLPYRVRDDFLSNSALSFYHVLRGVVGDRAVICPEVNTSAIFYVTRPNENQSFRGRISQKSIDFLLCEPKTMKPLVGIELDDSSHARSDRQTRDVFVNKVFEAAGLPLLRIPAKRDYTTADIARQLEPILGPIPIATTTTPIAVVTPSSAVPTSEPPAPMCPKCGIPMVVRIVGQGEHKGKKFYGCSNYPRCRQMLPYEFSE